jgi:uncharacterized protein YhaN
MNMPAYGPFTDFQLEFGRPGLQVIYGPNESGKSSSLRAFRALLYGMHRQTTDNFLHPYSKLAVEAKLQHSDGSVLEVVRRKGRINTLRTLDGETVDESRLSGFIGNLSEEVFDRLYGIDHNTLASGGKALLAEGGKVGESLFAANVGPAFREVRENLRHQANELWRPRGRTQALNMALSDWKEAKKEAKAASLQVSKFESLQDELDQQESAVRAGQEQLAAVRARLQTLQNRKSALPSWARYKELKSEIANSAELPDLGEEFSLRREQVRTEYDQAMSNLKRLKAEKSQLEERLRELPEQWPLLDLNEGIEKLYQRASRVEDIQTEIPALVAQLKQLEHQTQTSRSNLGLSQDSESESFPDSSIRAEARLLAAEHQEISVALEATSESITRLNERLKRLESQQAELEETGELADLELMLARARSGSSWEERLHELRAEYKIAKAALESELQALPFWSGDLESLKSLAVPSYDSLERMDKELQECRSLVQQAQRSTEQTRGNLEALQKELSRLEADGPVPSPELLQELRGKRRKQFDGLIARWDSGETVERSLFQISNYREAASEADRQADQIARDADRVATRAEYLRRKQEIELDLTRRNEERRETEATLAKVEKEWQALWGDGVATVRSPREMRRWLEQRQSILAKQRDFDTVHQEGLKLDLKRQKALDELVCALKNAFPNLSLPLDNLSQTLEYVEKKLSQAKEASGKRSTLNLSIVETSRESDDMLARLEHLKGRLADWKPRWSATLSHFSLTHEPSPKALNATLADYDQLQQLIVKVDSTRQELEKLRSESEVFEAQVAEMATALPGLEPQAPWTMARTLHALLAQSKEQQKNRSSLETSLAKLEQAREEARYQLQTAQEAVGKILVEARASDMEELPAIERDARHHNQLKVLLEEVSDNLRSLGSGATLEEFCQTLSELSPEELEAELEELTQRQDELEDSQSALLQRVGELKEKIQQMDGSDRAAQAAEVASQHMTQGVEFVAQLMRLELAEHILKTEIENYRTANEGPILKKSSHYFHQLTCGDYVELHTGYLEDSEEPIIQAVSKSGRLVNVEGMSDGTRDQLFLSLRLATIDLRAEHAEPFPLIADDLLVQFDQQRALATLRVLAEFAQHHQVLLFTHLERDLKLAQELDSNLADVKSLERLSL